MGFSPHVTRPLRPRAERRSGGPPRAERGSVRMSTEDAPLPAAPKVDGSPPHLLIVRAPYYKAVVDGLPPGAERILSGAGASSEVLDIAGAYELAQAIRLATRGNKKFDGYVALG